MPVVVSAGPSAIATAISMIGRRQCQSRRGSSANAQGKPTPRNIHSIAGAKRYLRERGVAVRLEEPER